jgi:hypothetical protein
MNEAALTYLIFRMIGLGAEPRPMPFYSSNDITSRSVSLLALYLSLSLSLSLSSRIRATPVIKIPPLVLAGSF